MSIIIVIVRFKSISCKKEKPKEMKLLLNDNNDVLNGPLSNYPSVPANNNLKSRLRV